METTRDMVRYYAQHAQEDERIYRRTERRPDPDARRSCIEETIIAALASGPIP